ncbi:FixH family protein [Hahella ganghwensis]|uniref:FixH family protein n=1 Tax=Hahella ganghwensis TaxID=286420 RepID=UPI0003A1B149|nr:FixH family protein [Hahella ganghwensis]
MNYGLIAINSISRLSNRRGNLSRLWLLASLVLATISAPATVLAAPTASGEDHHHHSDKTPPPPTKGSLLMQNASNVWQQAVALEDQSGEAIKHATMLRKEVSNLRSKVRKLKASKNTGDMEKLLQETITQLASQVTPWQALAGNLRAEADKLKGESQQIMKQGFISIWQPWIKHEGKLALSSMSGETMAMAHNVQVRSMSPSVPNPTMEKMKQDDGESMSINRMAMSGQSIPPGLETSSFKVSRNQDIFGHIEAIPDDNTKPGELPLNEIHQWYLILSDTDGQPIHDAKVRVEGHMPGHVHGLPTQPEIVEEVSPGVYRVDGIKFQMSGWWVMQFLVNHQDEEDSITFNLVL